MRLIDADKLKAHYSWWANSTNYDLCEMKYVVDDIVDVQPTIDPVKYGEWIWTDDGYCCSVCNYYAHGDTVEVMDGTFQYCPNCGAKMEEGEEV